MDSLRAATKGNQKAFPPPVPVQPAPQDFLFVDASQSAKSSRQGRRNARSFVMQKARRERPWSTSKHAAKHRKTRESTSPANVGTPDLSYTSTLSTPSPPIVTTGPQYFVLADPNHSAMVKHDIRSDCRDRQCRSGQTLCPRCLRLLPLAPVEDVDNSLFDPFGTIPVAMNARDSELLYHCKCWSLRHVRIVSCGFR